jgi:hypothetical protein
MYPKARMTRGTRARSVAFARRVTRTPPWHGVCLISSAQGTPEVDLCKQINERTSARAAMRIYDIEFDIDSFLDEMEEMQRARRQRQQQIHRGSDVGAGVMESAEHDAD